ncbi:MAG: SUMF1/EgtB/PvdO family nonheme iron enzyme [SAR324 cluster bacterium]|nr:SUMF1/EgtB/PvdO family nonheme iron enzyme [SAR324 cluster bacterium]
MKNNTITPWKLLGFGLAAVLSIAWAGESAAATNTELLSGRIAQSFSQELGLQYQGKTIAISRIKKRNPPPLIDINELIDYSNVELVGTEKFRVTDRSKLELILKEQRIQLSESVTPNEYKELGKILGIHLFIYGTLYRDVLILKAIDVQTSSVVWANIFTIEENSINHLLLHDFQTKLSEALAPKVEKLKENNISKISFWKLEVPPKRFSMEETMDYLTVSISKGHLFTMIDRENLKTIAEEQQLNQSVFIDESEARQLGQLHGVDAFLYGKVVSNDNDNYTASMKMMSIFSGEIIWAKLIKFSLPSRKKGKIDVFAEKARERQDNEEFAKGMALIRGGSFLMGSEDPLYDSSPEHSVTVNPFFIDIYEVSNEEYLKFVRANRHRTPTQWPDGIFAPALKDHPVVGVSWEDAEQYCKFRKKRLPTEAEWEMTVRGTGGRKYPWGRNFSANFTVTVESGLMHSVSVKTKMRDITPDNVHHLAGNVREFVDDIYLPYQRNNPNSSSGRQERVVRGSSWAHGEREAAGYYRGHTFLNLAWPDIGFRCARDTRTKMNIFK